MICSDEKLIKIASKVLTKILTIEIPSLLFLKYVNFIVLVIKTVKEILNEFTSFTQYFLNICIIIYFTYRSTKMI